MGYLRNLATMRSVLLLVGTLTALAVPPTHAQRLLVYHLPVTGRPDFALTRLVERALESAEQSGAVALILEIRSSGGRVDASQLLMEAIAATGVPVYALVSEHAWGPAALVALAADSVFMAPGSSVGAGESAPMLDDLPRPAQRALRDAFRSLVERWGVDPLIGEAMVDRQVAIPGVVGSDELLTLDATSAVKLGLAAAQVDSLDDLLSELDLVGAEIVTVGREWTTTTISVTNRNWQDVRIYLVRSRARYRLGTVTSMNAQVFEIPQNRLPTGAVIQVLAEVIGSSEHVATEEVRVQPGLVIEWVIGNVLSHSSYFYFVRD